MFANVVGALILLIALGVWAIRRAAPNLLAAWQSKVTTWIGRAALVAMAGAADAGLLRDGIDILG